MTDFERAVLERLNIILDLLDPRRETTSKCPQCGLRLGNYGSGSHFCVGATDG